MGGWCVAEALREGMVVLFWGEYWLLYSWRVLVVYLVESIEIFMKLTDVEDAQDEEDHVVR